MSHLRFMLFARLFVLTIVAYSLASFAAETTSNARLYCLSLRFDKATVRQFGQTSTLELGSVPGEPLNGELAPMFDPNLPTHGALFRLDNPTFGGEPVRGSVFFDLPPGRDTNGDSFDDFFQTDQEVPSTVTHGFFTTDIDDGEVTATWSRAADSATGTCRLRMIGVTFGQLPDFVHTFELLEYRGQAATTSGSNDISGRIALARTTSAPAALGGPIAFGRHPTNRFNLLQLLPGQWTNQLGQIFAFTNSVVARTEDLPAEYTGFVLADDGEPATLDPDYFVWFFHLNTTTDSDGDGIPDFADDPPDTTAPPRLAIVRAAPGVTLFLSGRAGTTVELQEITALGATNDWRTLSTVRFTNETESVSLPRPPDPRFWRIRSGTGASAHPAEPLPIFPGL